MDALAIMALIEKGLMVASTVIEAGGNAIPVISAVQKLTGKAQTGSVTDADLTEIETFLDAQLAEFNTPLPDEPN